ncbi:hypothetical protein [Jatrophihabitans fulvus]
MGFDHDLAGGHPNSLGRTGEVVDRVLADGTLLDELFATISSDDAVVRMRVGDALEKICRERPDWFVPRVTRILDELGPIEQPSVQWHVAQLLDHLRNDLTDHERERATALLQHNLATSPDWIVRNVTMDVLARWSADDAGLRAWLRPQLERFSHDTRASVAKRATRHLQAVGGQA